MAPAHHFSWAHLGLIVLGGALGVAARAALVWPVEDVPGLAIVWATMGVNVVGAFALGVVVATAGTRHPSARAFLGTGALGGFTTYSAFATQVAGLASAQPWWAVGVAAASIVVGLAAAALGLRAGRLLSGGAGRPETPGEAE